MKITLCAMGRMRTSPEADLVADYIDRFNKTGSKLGLGPLDLKELELKKGGGAADEADLLRRARPKGSLLLIADERGELLSSPAFAKKLQSWADQGTPNLTLMIGGADGLHQSLRQEADFALSFGKMVWPHMLARIMLCEQLYRAANILSGGPYHRA